MAKINLLDSSIYNRIAAGEVIDRPYSVVKEFIENSIDAGAKHISVYIERGGKNLIKVADDGEGIEKSDLRSALMPHATSKIAKVEDLDQIHTLGFRGEALASIASVSKLTIRSKAASADDAFEISCYGGQIGEIRSCALGCGTEICAEGLFYNTPVREKFLKSDKGEESEISTVVSRFVLGNPNVAFQYFIDGKLNLQSYGGGLEEALLAVYGANTLQQCYRIDATKHGIRLYGYIGKPSFAKANRSYQTVFVNGRCIANNTISSAIANAYASYLMKRQFAFCVLFLEVPPQAVDVNVHPNKSDVRFENNQIIYGSVYSILSGILDGNANALEYVLPMEGMGTSAKSDKEQSFSSLADKKAAQTLSSDIHAVDSGFSNDETSFQNKDHPSALSESLEKAAEINLQPHAGGSSKTNPVANEQHAFGGESEDVKQSEKSGQCFTCVNGGNLNSDQNNAQEKRPDYSEIAKKYYEKPIGENGYKLEFHDVKKADFLNDPVAEKTCDDSIFLENKRFLERQDEKAKQEKIIFENSELKGCLFNTYLLYEEGDNVYIIDQHAAHERLIFDRLKEEMDTRSVVSQPMLLPYILNTNKEEFYFLHENLQVISDIGFEIEEFGENSFKISSIPMDLQKLDLKGFFDEVLKELGTYRSIRLSELLRDKLASAACKHAVKGGMNLTEDEKQKLFSMLHGNLGLKCPHGRPIAVKLTRYEIEKMFKRIV